MSASRCVRAVENRKKTLWDTDEHNSQKEIWGKVVKEGGRSTQQDEGDALTSLVIAVHTDLRQVPQEQTQHRSLDRGDLLGGPSKQYLKGVGKRNREREEANTGSSMNRHLP